MKQSAAIDHQYNYAWFTYKRASTGRPMVPEYYHDTEDYKFWQEDALPLEAGYTSLRQTVPRVIFSLPAAALAAEERP